MSAITRCALSLGLLLAVSNLSAAQQGPALSWLVSPDQVLDDDADSPSHDLPRLEPPQPAGGGLDESGSSRVSSSDSAPLETSLDDRLDKLEEELAELQEEPEKTAEKYPADPTAKFSMQLQADAYTFGQDEANIDTVGNIPNGTAFRRARVGWSGDWERTQYRIEFDFAQSGRPTFLDVWAGLQDVPVVDNVRVGHFFEPFSLERMTSNRYGTFLERSLLDSFFVPARNMGIAFSTHSENERLTASMGAFAYASDAFGDDVGFDRGEALTGRITALPYWCDGGRHYVHLGAAMSLRNPDEDEVRYATQPEARLGAASPNVPFFVDTGTLVADQESRGGLELAWVNGPFSIQSEYMCAVANRIGDPNVFFDGVYVEASLFLTGEHRPYQPTAFGGGAFGRVIPYHNACIASRSGSRGCGWGAWEVATRLSHLDGDDEDVTGRELTNVTFGMNWHLTPFLRVSSNYIHAFLDDSTIGDSDADILGMRVQYEF